MAEDNILEYWGTDVEKMFEKKKELEISYSDVIFGTQKEGHTSFCVVLANTDSLRKNQAKAK